MQLARDLHKTRKELLENIDSKEISDWLAFFIYQKKHKEKIEHDEKQKVLQEKFKSLFGTKLKKV